MRLSKIKITNKGLYWGLILTFLIIYICVGFVSTLHAITFFQMANTTSLAILLALAFEVGQSSVLFSILMAKKGDEKFLPWILMILLTGLQITGNVFSSFKHIMTSGNLDWQYFQKSILFGVQAANPEMYQVIISWLQGALLPIVALGLTALVAQKINILIPREQENEETNKKVGSVPDEEVDKIIVNEVEKRVKETLSPIDLTNVEPDITKDKEEIKKQLELQNELLKQNVELNAELDEEAERLTPKLIAPQLVSITPDVDPLLSYEFEKDFVEPEKIIKKRGRPPKQTETAAEPKKEQGFLQKEENVSVPQEQRKNRSIDPLKRKSTTQTIKNLDEIMKPSKGEEVIKLLESIDKAKLKESIIETNKDEDIAQESILGLPEVLTPYINGGVEVIDAKAIPKLPEVKKN